MRIVVADDHAVTREGMRRLLAAEADLEVIAEVADGAEAIRVVETLRPDALLLDINMPRVNGVQVAQTLGETAPDTAIVVLTGYDEEHYIETLIRRGVKGYLTKASSAREVISALRTVNDGRMYFPSALLASIESVAHSTEVDAPTPRELEVLRLVSEGRRNGEIATHLSLSERTVHSHLRSLFQKAAVSSRSELVYIARQRGWVA